MKTPKILLVAINAKYIHSALGVYSLYNYLSPEEKAHVEIKEFTVNQSEELITSEILRAPPDVLAFSCYIWNIKVIESLIETFKQTKPDIPIILGGPEVSFEHEYLYNLGADIIVQGEGEEPFKKLVQKAIKREAFIKGETFTGCAPLESIPFTYPSGFDHTKNRIIYYETSRGCVNNCAFCLSSTTKGVCFLPWERVKSELDIFLTAKLPQVKFIDRTFNSHKKHAMQIWQYLIENDNGITNFHFEIAGDTLDDETLALLSTARNGLFQFEIGVQSVNPQTLAAINRKTDTEKLLENIKRLKHANNIHIHLDLIVGLPFEDYESFKHSFNRVFEVRPHKLQVGFLKFLKGSRLRQQAATFGAKYKKEPPYEVLETDFITFEQVNHIKKIEHMVETFYGSKGFESCVRYFLEKFSSPFELFDLLAQQWERESKHLVAHKKAVLYTFLHDFAATHLPEEIMLLKELLKYDMLLQENVRTFPAWIDNYYKPDNRLITRTTAIHSFEYTIFSWQNGGELKQETNHVEYNYSLAIENRRARLSCDSLLFDNDKLFESEHDKGDLRAILRRDKNEIIKMAISSTVFVLIVVGAWLCTEHLIMPRLLESEGVISQVIYFLGADVVAGIFTWVPALVFVSVSLFIAVKNGSYPQH